MFAAMWQSNNADYLKQVRIRSGSLWAVVVIFVVPTFCQMTSHIVEIGDTISLSCTKSGSAIFWDRADTEAGAIAIAGTMQIVSDHISLTVSDDGTQTLTIHDVTLEDEAVYQCYTPFPVDYTRYNVTVIKQPSAFYVLLPPEIFEDSPASISCTVEQAKPAPELQLNLQHNGSVVPMDAVTLDVTYEDNTVTRTATVTTQLGREHHRSRVGCLATSAVTGFNDTVQKLIHVKLPPLGVRLDSEDTVLEGDLVTFSCLSHGAAPAADITWYRDGAVVAVDAMTTQSADGTWETLSELVWLVSLEDDGAVLGCEATNEALQHTGDQPLWDSTTIVVLYAPRVVADSPLALVGWEGNCKTIGCAVTANPEANVTWYHDNRSIALTDRHHVAPEPTSPSLTICDLEREDAGHYVCEGINDLGSDRSMPIAMEVKYGPSCWPSQLFRYGASLGDLVTVTCWIQAFPSDTILFGWHVNGTWSQVDGVWDDQHPGVAYSSLNYTVSTDGHYSDIECKGINGVGHMEEPCVFTILPPSVAEPPSSCFTQRMYYNRIEVACSGSYNGGSDIVYIVQVYNYDEFQDVLNSTLANFEIGNLAPLSTYSYRVCVTNVLFPDALNCSQTFNMSTAADPFDASSAQSASGDMEQLYLIALPVLGVLFTVFIITIAMVEHKRKKNDLKKRNPCIASVSAPPKPPRAPDVPPFRQLSDPHALGLRKPPKVPSSASGVPEVAGNPAFVTSPEDPWYDVAGGAYLNGAYVMVGGESVRAAGRQGPPEADRTYMCLEDPRMMMMMLEEDLQRQSVPPPPPLPDRHENREVVVESRPSRHIRNESKGSISPISRPQTPKLADIPEHDDERPLSAEERYTRMFVPIHPPPISDEMPLNVELLPEFQRRGSSGRRKRQGALPKVPEEHGNGGGEKPSGGDVTSDVYQQ